jgi:hypothetical protein
MDGSTDSTKSFFSLASGRLPVFFKEMITVTARNIHLPKKHSNELYFEPSFVGSDPHNFAYSGSGLASRACLIRPIRIGTGITSKNMYFLYFFHEFFPNTLNHDTCAFDEKRNKYPITAKNWRSCE